ncbi:hypothetical protein KRR38_33670 [Novosphingobium sp. G106]|uniref:hypothetical protein n=1 Tax=Novosphingobium sp. G106 TaxID=2849500 RepID=UPI001C2D96D2|nr:hypothetical protein [Novosphingobium sp. G106]MBV1692184.1 hypothetical protein [Novosphingobium sp. G106]MBV1692454.1 hypothetical protein [Novosphingobium sp. G106]
MGAVLQFPDARAKGRKRQRGSYKSMGEWALDALDDGDRPGNVLRFASVRAKAERHSGAKLAFMLVVTMLRTAPLAQQEEVLHQLRAIESMTRDTIATSLLDALDKRRR